MNKRIAKKILAFLENKSMFENHQEKQKVEYILLIIINEFSKSISLLIFFMLFSWGTEYLLSLFVVMITRSFAGGSHQKTSKRCLAHSLFFFTSIMFMEKLSYIKENFGFIICALIVVYLLFSPQVSKVRGNIDAKKHLSLKMKSVFGVCLAGSITLIFDQISDTITATLLAILTDFFLLIISKEVLSHVGKG